LINFRGARYGSLLMSPHKIFSAIHRLRCITAQRCELGWWRLRSWS